MFAQRFKPCTCLFSRTFGNAIDEHVWQISNEAMTDWSKVWADIEKEAPSASDAFLVVEDTCRFASDLTTQQSHAQYPGSLLGRNHKPSLPMIQDDAMILRE